MDKVTQLATRIAYLESVLNNLVQTIDVTGGVVKGLNGYFYPAADEDWSDLGDVYMSACTALEIDPKVTQPATE